MAIDLKSLDKKKLLVIVGAVAAGLVAVVLTNAYIETTTKKRAQDIAGAFNKKEMKQLVDRLKSLEKENNLIKKNLVALGKEVKTAPRQKTGGRKNIEEEPSLASMTPPGQRAVAVTVDRLMAAGGLVLPGDTVDIIAHLEVPKDPYDKTDKKLTTVTLFQNVLVMAVNGMTDRQKRKAVANKDKSKNLLITFALNPQEASLLTFARKNGKLQLLIRGVLDKDAYKLPEADWEALSNYIEDTQDMDIGVVTEDNMPAVEKKAAPSKRKPDIEVFENGQYRGLK